VRLTKVKKLSGPPRSHERETIGERLRSLRLKQRPYMTQKELSTLSGVHTQIITELETGRKKNFHIDTLRKIALALRCYIFIKIRTTPSRFSEDILLSNPELPPPPRLGGKTSGRARWQALSHERSKRKNYRRKPRPSRHIETSDTPD
jgi:transcriptional regulator with XRE-family HTH domain